jgi:membrane-bound metal-dependent hydrolase YbcI (DUF457 family)
MSPFTPFHFGPGLLMKSVSPRRFSFKVFVLANVLMDFEPLYFIATNQFPMHRFFHTYLGAVMVGAACAFAAKTIWKNFSISAVTLSAFLGTVSHVFLDSMMHADMRPLHPWMESNGLLNRINVGHLHIFCILSGIAGIGILGAAYLHQRNKH